LREGDDGMARHRDPLKAVDLLIQAEYADDAERDAGRRGGQQAASYPVPQPPRTDECASMR